MPQNRLLKFESRPLHYRTIGPLPSSAPLLEPELEPYEAGFERGGQTKEHMQLARLPAYAPGGQRGDGEGRGQGRVPHQIR